jgi:Protein of unknown function (DUF3108)
MMLAGAYNCPAAGRLPTFEMTLGRCKSGLAGSGGLLARLACVVLGCVPLLIGQSPARRATVAPQPPAKAAVREAEVPFAGTERLAFQVLFSKFTVKAAALEFTVVEHRNFFGHAAWHFRATAQTVDTVRMLYSLDDQFDSYTDAVKLTSLQYEMYLREAGDRQDRTWRMDTGEEPLAAGVAAARVQPGTRDPLALLYVLRATDWKKTPELRVPVFDGTHLYDVRARLAETGGEVKVPSGQFRASRIALQIFEQGRELTDTTFSVWLAEDASRTPVLIEAALPIGSARVEFTGRR